jgi:mannose-6-phosphate isomerase-like protein (cupin superfamily)
MGATRSDRRAESKREGLSAAELREFVARLAAQPERGEHLFDEDDDARVHELIWDGPEVNAWVIRRSENADTAYHDLDESAAAIAVLAGHVREDLLSLGGLPRTRLIGPGETFTIEPTAIHRVLHAGGGPALTIHAYSPPLRRTGAYRVTPDGVLLREVGSPEVERSTPGLALA